MTSMRFHTKAGPIKDREFIAPMSKEDRYFWQHRKDYAAKRRAVRA